MVLWLAIGESDSKGHSFVAHIAGIGRLFYGLGDLNKHGWVDRLLGYTGGYRLLGQSHWSCVAHTESQNYNQRWWQFCIENQKQGTIGGSRAGALPGGPRTRAGTIGGLRTGKRGWSDRVIALVGGGHLRRLERMLVPLGRTVIPTAGASSGSFHFQVHLWFPLGRMMALVSYQNG